MGRKLEGWMISVVVLALTWGEGAAANTPPVAGDDSIKVNGFGSPVLVDLLANDSDADGDPLTVTIASGAGSDVEILEDGILRFLPASCLSDNRVITYQVRDGRGGTRNASVTLRPGHCNDNLEPIVAIDPWTTPVNTPTEVPVLQNDTDPDGDALTVVRVGEFQHGTGQVTTDGLRVFFNPETSFTGPGAGFRYWVSDGRGGEASAFAHVTVTASQGQGAVDDLVSTPQGKILFLSSAALMANDDPGLAFFSASSPHGDRVEVIRPPSGDPHVLYFPPPGHVGQRTFQYTATTASGTPSTAEVAVTVYAPTSSMRASDDFLETERGGCLTVDLRRLTEDDSWSSSEAPAAVVETSPLLGSLTQLSPSNGDLWAYSPPSSAGLDAFRYRALDSIDGSPGGGSTDVATVVVDLAPPGSLPHPVALEDSFLALSPAAVQLDVLRNDYDPGCEPVTLIEVFDDGEVKASVLRVLSNGRVEYQPFGSATGEDTFFYRVRNASGATAVGEARVQLQSSVPAPWARFEYRDCDVLETCVVDGSTSWDAVNSRPWSFIYSPAGLQTCDEYWHFDGVNPPYPPPAVPCDVPSREAVQRLEDRYSAPGLNRVELTLWEDAEVRDTLSRRVPLGGTTTGWQIGWSCTNNACTFWPEGNWLEGVVDRFWWYFDGVRQESQCGPFFGCGQRYVDPDAESFGMEEMLHSYTGAAAGTEFDVTLVAYVFDRLDPVVVTERITIPTPPPAPPTALTASNDVCPAGGPLISWADQAHTEEGFRVYRGVNGAPPAFLAELEADETEFQDLYSGSRTDELTFRVSAFNAGGESAFAEISARPTPSDCGAAGAAPLAPSHLAADQPSSGVTLRWRDNSAQEAGFRIYRRQGGGSFALIGASAPNTLTYHDHPVAVDTSYTYRVAAFNAQGETPAAADLTVTVPDFLFADSFETGDASAWSQVSGLVAGTSSALLAKRALEELELLELGSIQHLIRPSELRAAAYRRGGVDLVWKDNSSNEDGFRILRKRRGQPPEELAVLPPGTTTYFDGPLEPAVEVRYRVEAFTEAGKKKHSEVLRAEPPLNLFRASFETGDLRRWSSVSDPGGRLAGTFRAALFGNFGLSVSLGEGPAGWAVDETPNEEPVLRARVLLDTRSILSPAGLGEGEPLATFLEAREEDGAELFSVRLVRLGSGLGLDARLHAADGSLLATSPVPLDGGVHSLEVGWDASDPSGMGRFRVWLDGRRAAVLEGWPAAAPRRQLVDQLRLGALDGAPVEGVLGLDELAVRRGGGWIRRQGLAGHLLTDGFEHDEPLGWQRMVSGGGAVGLAARPLEGRRAVEFSLAGAGDTAFLERRLDYAERHLLAGVRIDPASLELPPGAVLPLLTASIPITDEPQVLLGIRRTAEGLRAVARARDGTGWSSAGLPLPNGPAQLEIEWRSSTAPDMADGSLVLRVRDEATDDTSRKRIQGLATPGSRVQVLRLGVSEPAPAGASGSLVLDELKVWR